MVESKAKIERRHCSLNQKEKKGREGVGGSGEPTRILFKRLSVLVEVSIETRGLYLRR